MMHQTAITFFERRLQVPANWLLACVAPLSCFVLHWVSFCLINSRTVGRLALSQPSESAQLLAHQEWLMLAGLFAAIAYTAVPLFGAIIMICVDVLKSDSRSYVRLIEMVCFCFYLGVPFSLVSLVLSLSFVPPNPLVGVASSTWDLLEIARDYRIVVQSTPTLVAIKWLGFASIGCMTVGMATAYHVVCGVSARFCAVGAIALLIVYLRIL